MTSKKFVCVNERIDARVEQADAAGLAGVRAGLVDERAEARPRSARTNWCRRSSAHCPGDKRRHPYPGRLAWRHPARSVWWPVVGTPVPDLPGRIRKMRCSRRRRCPTMRLRRCARRCRVDPERRAAHAGHAGVGGVGFHLERSGILVVQPQLSVSRGVDPSSPEETNVLTPIDWRAWRKYCANPSSNSRGGNRRFRPRRG